MKKLLLLSLTLLSCARVLAQAPNISYNNPSVYTVGTPITPLAPTNTGGAIPSNGLGQVITIAGKAGVYGSLDGPNLSATFSGPTSTVEDASGNIYVSDQNNSKIRKISPAGIVSTFAGSGTRGFVDGQGTAARFYYTVGMAIDSVGNIYVADISSGLSYIRKITPSGLVSIFAGNGTAGSISGQPNAIFNSPQTIAFDAGGTMYVADTKNYVIKKIAPSGLVTILAGSGVPGYSNGTGSAASFDSPTGIAVDRKGNVYVTDYSDMIRKITPAGVVTTLAGSPYVAGSSDGFGSAASFKRPAGLAVDGMGYIYVADGLNNLIRKISPSGLVTTLAGSLTQGSSDGLGPSAGFFNPVDLNLDAAGDLYITDQANGIIRKIKQYGYTISPTLPDGLSFDITTGIISGSPTITSVTTTYTITAYNSTGTSTTTVNIGAISADATLSALTLSAGSLAFSAGTNSYTVNVPNAVTGVTIVPTTHNSGAVVRVNNKLVISGAASDTVALAVGNNTIAILVTAQNGNTNTYTLTINRAKANQIITFNALANYKYGNTAITLSATGGASGIPITYSSSNIAIATVSGNTVTITGAGTCTITALQAGNASYNAAISVDRLLTVNPVALTITANNQSKNYGAVNPTLIASYTGFVNGDDATKLTTQPGIVTTATTASAVGTYPETASGAASANYTIAYAAGTLTVNPAALTITANNQSKNYGAANPTLTSSYTGFVNGDDATKLTTQPTMGTTATTASAVGTYPVTASGAASTNYAITYAAGALTVNPVVLTITANNQSRNLGVANPVFTASYTGFVNGDNATMLSTQPVFTTAATANSSPGTYPITVSGATSANYTFNYVAGTMFVSPSLPAGNFTIVANSATCHGSANGAITITAAQNLNYTATITGGSVNASYPFTTGTTISNLAAGTYNVCFTVAGQSSYQQCFTAVITEPKDLAVYTAINKTVQSVNLTLDGGSIYYITLNGVITTTAGSTITLALNKGVNELTVTTDKPCQGIIQKQISISDDLIAFPNPFTTRLNVNLGDTNLPQATVELYGINGVRVYSKQFTNQSGIVQLDLSGLKPAMYLLKIESANSEKIFKVVKQ